MQRPFIKTGPNILIIAIFHIACFPHNRWGVVRHMRQVLFKEYDVRRQRKEIREAFSPKTFYVTNDSCKLINKDLF